MKTALHVQGVAAHRAWLAFYEPHVPDQLDYPDITLPDALDQIARENPDFPFLIFKGRALGYRQVKEAIDRFSAALGQLGVGKGSRVALHLPNCPQFPIAYFATLRSGAIVVPCNPVYTARELTHQLNDSGATVILTLSLTYPLIREIRAQTSLQHVVVAKIKTYFPTYLKWLFSLAVEKKRGHWVDFSSDDNTYWYEDLLDEVTELPEPFDINGHDTAVLMYTGGTTGLAKGAELTHNNILANAYQNRVWTNTHDKPVRVLASLPLFHSYGMSTCMNPTAVAPGTMILVPDPRDTTDVLKSIHNQRPQLFPGVPAMYVAINNHPSVTKYDLRSLEVCISGAAPLPPEVQERFQALTGARLVEGYGLSEASPVTHSNPARGESRIGTIGLPFPDTEAKIVDAETGEREMAVGEPGELCLRGPQVMKGYWNMPAETAHALRSDPEGGDPWLYTGDMAIMNQDGYFSIVDRKKDLILGAGGYNIYPREIEDVLYEHPKVLEAAAIGVPIEGKGERVKAFVVLKNGHSATEDEMLAYCHENLAPQKVPKFIEFRSELPKSQIGKVLRRLLIKETGDVRNQS